MEEDVKRAERNLVSATAKKTEKTFCARQVGDGEVLKLTGDHVLEEPAGATVYTGGV